MRGLSNDRGASGVFIAICLVFLIGFAGMAVDVGALYAERTELQKGAEAAVLAIAEDCGHGTKPCDVPTASTTAEDYIDANATDLAGAMDSLVLDAVGQTVTVVDRTERSDGGSIFLPFFAQVIGFEGTTVRAQASAAWGAPSGMATLPIVISECEWMEFGASADDWPSYPADFDPWPPQGSDEDLPTVFTFHDGNTTEDCNAVAGQDADGDGRLPGGFGWVDSDANCTVETDEGDLASEDPGVNVPNQCTADLTSLVGTVIFVPWFDDVNGLGGSNGEYHIAGYSPFYLTGFRFPGHSHDSLYDGKKMCVDGETRTPVTGDVHCIEGYFVKATVTDGDLGGDDRGVLVVKLTG